MKETFTYAIERDTYEKAKKKAFTKKTTVSKIVREYLKRYVRGKKKKAI